MWSDAGTVDADLDEVRRTLDHLAYRRTRGPLTPAEATLYRRLTRLEVELLVGAFAATP